MYTGQLSTFICVAENRSFTATAEKLGVTPVSVMKQINSLEERLGVILFNRTNRGVELTPQGKIIYNAGVRIIREADQALSKAKEESQQLIRIGTSMLNPAKPLTDLYSQHEELRKSFSLQIIPFEDDRRKILSVLTRLGSSIDIVVGACGSDEWKSKTNFLQLGSYSVDVAVPYTHRLAGRKSLKIEDLYGEEIMIGVAGDAPGVDAVRSELERYPEIRITDTEQFYDAEVFNQAVERGCLLLTLSPWNDIQPSLVTIPAKWDFRMPYGILYSKKPSDAVSAFIAAIEKCDYFSQNS